jgi:hypothetical protein
MKQCGRTITTTGVKHATLGVGNWWTAEGNTLNPVNFYFHASIIVILI